MDLNKKIGERGIRLGDVLADAKFESDISSIFALMGFAINLAQLMGMSHKKFFTVANDLWARAGEKN